MPMNTMRAPARRKNTRAQRRSKDAVVDELIIESLESAESVVLRWTLVRLCLLGWSTDVPIELPGKIPGEGSIFMVDDA